MKTYCFNLFDMVEYDCRLQIVSCKLQIVNFGLRGLELPFDLFDRNIEPSCGYCGFGTPLGDNIVACTKRGIMASFGFCGAFRYEPTKREPHTLPSLKISEMTEEDFSI